MRRRTRPGWARILEGVKPSQIKSREGARRAAGDAQVRSRRSCRKTLPPLGGLNATPVEKLAQAFRLARPGLRPGRARRRTGGAARAASSPAAFAPATACSTRFAYHFTPAGSMLESGALALGCTVVPPAPDRPRCRSRAIRGLRITRLRRHALVPQADRREGRRAEGRHLVPEAGAGRRRIPAAGAAQCHARARHPVTQMYGSADLGVIAYESLGRTACRPKA